MDYLFFVNPGLGQGRFYLQHLNAITCANAGCTLVLPCFAKLLLHKAGLINGNSSQLITWLGIAIGSFIIVYSATRGVLFATLLISVAIAIAYDSFFREQSQLINTKQVIKTDLSKYAEFSVKLSNEMPFLYGAFAIITAIGLGILAAWLRKIISDLRKKKPKEEVKFPVK